MTDRITLGFHSPTEWVFFPEVVALYDHVRMNLTDYEKAVDKGLSSPSNFERTKSEILQELNRQKIIHVQSYKVSSERCHQLESLLNYLFVKYEDDIRRLGIKAFTDFINHEEATIRILVSEDDPYYKDVTSQLPRLRAMRNQIQGGTLFHEIHGFREVIRGYFENALYTPLIAKDTYNPVFDWFGYAPFEEWLIRLRYMDERHTVRLRRGTKMRVLQPVSEIMIPGKYVNSTDDINRLIAMRSNFLPIREQIALENQHVWDDVDAAIAAEPSELPAFIRDFESSLNARNKRLQNMINQVYEDTSQELASHKSRFARYLFATLGSFLPGTGSLENVLEDIYSRHVLNHVREQFPALRAYYVYEDVVKASFRDSRKHHTSVAASVDYVPKTYWDEA